MMDTARPLVPSALRRKRHHMSDQTPDKPSVLFVCVHNAGWSQMAAGWLRQLAGDSVEVRSAGSEPADRINPVAVDRDGADDHSVNRCCPRPLADESLQDLVSVPADAA